MNGGRHTPAASPPGWRLLVQGARLSSRCFLCSPVSHYREVIPCVPELPQLFLPTTSQEVVGKWMPAQQSRQPPTQLFVLPAAQGAASVLPPSTPMMVTLMF